jgi:signal transduction histidine kinase
MTPTPGADVALLGSLAAAAAEATIALVFLGLSRAPGWESLRWLALASAAAAVFSSCNTAFLAPSTPDWLVLSGYQLNVGLGALVAVSWLRFALAFDERSPSWVDQAATAALLLVMALTLVPGLYQTGEVETVVKYPGIAYLVAPSSAFGDLAMGVMLLGFAAAMGHFVRAARQGRRRGAWALVAGFAIFFAVSANEMLSYAGVLDTPFVADLGLLVMALIAGALTGGRLSEQAALLAARTSVLDHEVEQRDKALGEAREALVRSERLAALGHLAAGVGHEINNPLTSVITNLRFVSDRLGGPGAGGADPPSGAGALPVDEELAEALGDAVEGARRIRRIVEDLRVFARPGEGVGGGGTPVDVASAATSGAKLAASDAKRRGVSLSARHEPGLRAWARPAELAHVLANLLLNAVQAFPAPRDGRTPRVEVRSFSEGPKVVIEVEDNGRGIPDDALRRIFEPYFTTKPVSEGIGLGLSLCHGLVTGMGGTIGVRSTLGEGTVFRIGLPRAEARREREDAHGSPENAASPQAASPPGPGSASEPAARPGAATASSHQRFVAPTDSGVGRVPDGPIDLLVVDDDPLVVRSMVRALRGYRVDVAMDAAEARRRLEAHPGYALVLCDVVMPGLDGTALYRQVRERRPELAQRFVFITGGALDVETRRFLEDAPVPTLTKPLEPGELEAVVRAATMVVEPVIPPGRADGG